MMNEAFAITQKKPYSKGTSTPFSSSSITLNKLQKARSSSTRLILNSSHLRPSLFLASNYSWHCWME